MRSCPVKRTPFGVVQFCTGVLPAEVAVGRKTKAAGEERGVADPRPGLALDCPCLRLRSGEGAVEMAAAAASSLATSA